MLTNPKTQLSILLQPHLANQDGYVGVNMVRGTSSSNLTTTSMPRVRLQLNLDKIHLGLETRGKHHKN